MPVILVCALWIPAKRLKRKGNTIAAMPVRTAILKVPVVVIPAVLVIAEALQTAVAMPYSADSTA